ncbi:MAG: hypothetical protein AB8B62_11180 [Roseobacter sp.]
MSNDFRWEIRRQTNVAHRGVDQLFSRLEVGQRDGLSNYLMIQLSCFVAMRGAARVDSVAWESLTQLAALIRFDLHSLGHEIEPRFQLKSYDTDPLALDYVIQCSRLSAQILKLAWQKSSDAEVLRAGAFFSLPIRFDQWHDVCHRLSGIPVGSPRAHSIIDSSGKLFEFFHFALSEFGMREPCLKVSA